MIVWFGACRRGRVNVCGGTKIETIFFCIQFLPFFPLSTSLVFEELGEGAYRGIPIPWQPASILAGYLRSWGVVAAAVCWLFVATERDGPSVPALVLALVATAAALFAFFRLGRLSLDERARRHVYEEVTGIPADVALLPDRDALRERLRAELQPSLGGDYRRAVGDLRAALETLTAPHALVLATTLARVEASLATGRDRDAWDAVSDEAFRRLVAVKPDVVDVVREADRL